MLNLFILPLARRSPRRHSPVRLEKCLVLRRRSSWRRRCGPGDGATMRMAMRAGRWGDDADGDASTGSSTNVCRSRDFWVAGVVAVPRRRRGAPQLSAGSEIFGCEPVVGYEPVVKRATWISPSRPRRRTVLRRSAASPGVSRARWPPIWRALAAPGAPPPRSREATTPSGAPA